MPDVNEQYTSARPDDATRAPEEEMDPLSIPAVNRFATAVSREVDEHLSDEVIEARLATVRRAALVRSGGGYIGERGFAQELARYGYTLVRIWLQIIRVGMQGAAAMGRQSVSLDETEIHELAKDTTARAIARLRDEQPEHAALTDNVGLKTAFLTECIRRLPDAYLSRQLELGRLAFEIEEEFGSAPAGVHLVLALRHCVTERGGETAHLLRTWTNGNGEDGEIIELTRQALGHAARLYPEIGIEDAASGNPLKGVRRT